MATETDLVTRASNLFEPPIIFYMRYRSFNQLKKFVQSQTTKSFDFTYSVLLKTAIETLDLDKIKYVL